MIFQEPMRALFLLKSIGDQLGEVIRLHVTQNTKEIHSLSVELLRTVGIREPESRLMEYPHQFSGGMCQRVMIAIALAGKPDLLIADECLLRAINPSQGSIIINEENWVCPLHNILTPVFLRCSAVCIFAAIMPLHLFLHYDMAFLLFIGGYGLTVTNRQPLDEVKIKIPCSRNMIYRLMKNHKIYAIRANSFKIMTNSDHDLTTYPNILSRNFKTEYPNQKWVTDIIYFPTEEDWATGDRITKDLAIRALNNAIKAEKPKPGFIHHSDRGVQYCSKSYQEILKEHGFIVSMSRPGTSKNFNSL